MNYESQEEYDHDMSLQAQADAEMEAQTAEGEAEQARVEAEIKRGEDYTIEISYRKFGKGGTQTSIDVDVIKSMPDRVLEVLFDECFREALERVHNRSFLDRIVHAVRYGVFR